jgi:hypothetical protein
MLIAQRQDVAIQTGSLHVDPDDRYMLDMEIASAADVPGDRFFTDPATVQPPPPPPDYTAIALEIEQSKVTQQSEESQLEAQLKEADSQREAEIKRYQVDTNAQLQLALAQIKQEGAVDLAKVQAFLKEAPAFMAGVIEKTGNQQSQLQEAADRLAETLEALRTAAEQPRELVREDGKIIGVRVSSASG